MVKKRVGVKKRLDARILAARPAETVLAFRRVGEVARGPRFKCRQCRQDLTEKVWQQVHESGSPVANVTFVRGIGVQLTLQSEPRAWRVLVTCTRGHLNVFSSGGLAGATGKVIKEAEARGGRSVAWSSFTVAQRLRDPHDRGEGFL